MRHRRTRPTAALAMVGLVAMGSAEQTSWLLDGKPPPTSTTPTTGRAGNPAATPGLVVPAITFPVLGGAPVGDDFHAPRDGGRRLHQGNDITAPKGAVLVAVRDGVISRLRTDAGGLSGNAVTIQADDGWTYFYAHLNNDTLPWLVDGKDPEVVAEGLDDPVATTVEGSGPAPTGPGELGPPNSTPTTPSASTTPSSTSSTTSSTTVSSGPTSATSTSTSSTRAPGSTSTSTSGSSPTTTPGGTVTVTTRPPTSTTTRPPGSSTTTSAPTTTTGPAVSSTSTAPASTTTVTTTPVAPTTTTSTAPAPTTTTTAAPPVTTTTVEESPVTPGWGFRGVDKAGDDTKAAETGPVGPPAGGQATDDGVNDLGMTFIGDLHVGDRVVAGQPIAYVGDSGNAEGTVPHLHFEIHQPDGDAIDPHPALARSQGNDVHGAGEACAVPTNPPWTPDPQGSGYALVTRSALGITRVRPFDPPTIEPVVTPIDPVTSGDTTPTEPRPEVEVEGSITVAEPPVRLAAPLLAAARAAAARDAAIADAAGGDPAGEPLPPAVDPQAIVAQSAPTAGAGWWILRHDGSVDAPGGAPALGSPRDLGITTPVVDLEAAPDGAGYLVLAEDGGVFAFGAAAFAGSAAGQLFPGEHAVALSLAPGLGYWIVTDAGRVLAFGGDDHGDLARSGHCTIPTAVDIATTASGSGYWVLTDDGQVWAFGDAPWYGDLELGRASTVTRLLPRPAPAD